MRYLSPPVGLVNVLRAIDRVRLSRFGRSCRLVGGCALVSVGSLLSGPSFALAFTLIELYHV